MKISKTFFVRGEEHICAYCGSKAQENVETLYEFTEYKGYYCDCEAAILEMGLRSKIKELECQLPEIDKTLRNPVKHIPEIFR